MTLALARVIQPAGALRGTIRVPSDKSIAHRALICAALADGRSEITLRLPGADVLSTVSALRSLGATVGLEETDEFARAEIDGLGDAAALGRLGEGSADCGNSGTTMRLVCGALASGAGVATLTGDASLSRRPMERVADPLRAMGADVSLDDGHAPLVVRGHRFLTAIDYETPVASAQVLGAIAFAALAADGTTTVRVPGVVRDHTERMLGALGVNIGRETDGVGSVTSITGPARLRPQQTHVPGDFSSAAAWLVAGAIHAEAVLDIEGVGLNPTRSAIIEVLRTMGARIDVEDVAEVAGEPVGNLRVAGGGSLRAVSLGPDDVAPLIDELPLIAVAMAAANGTSEVRGARELRVKESDRISAMAAALTAAGANVEELVDGWRIRRGRLLDAEIVTHGDHRIAVAMAVAGWTGIAKSVTLDDPACVAVSYPSFWDDARSIGALA